MSSTDLKDFSQGTEGLSSISVKKRKKARGKEMAPDGTRVAQCKMKDEVG